MIDDGVELSLDRIGGFVVAVAVGRFHHDVIGLIDVGGIADDWPVNLAQIAAEKESARTAVIAHPQFDHRRAENVAGIVKDRMNAIVDPHRHIVGDRLDQLQGAIDVTGGKEWLDGLLAPTAFLPMPFLLERGVFRLNLGGVAKNQFDQIGRGEGREDRASESILHQFRRQAAVVYVRVRQQNRIDIAKPDRGSAPNFDSNSFVPDTSRNRPTAGPHRPRRSIASRSLVGRPPEIAVSRCGPMGGLCSPVEKKRSAFAIVPYSLFYLPPTLPVNSSAKPPAS